MRHRFLLTASAGSFILATSTASGVVTELRARFVDPLDPVRATGANGTWAENGYNVGVLNTWRFYAVSDVADEILAVGSSGLSMTISTGDGSSFVNGGAGNNGLQRPTDFTVIPGVVGYQGQWDSFITIDGLATVFLFSGLATMLGATSMGMGGLVDGPFFISNSGWFLVPPSGAPNTTFNPETGDHEALIAQLTVPAGVSIAINNAEITNSTGTSAPLSATTGAVPPLPIELDAPSPFVAAGAPLVHAIGDLDANGFPDVAIVIPGEDSLTPGAVQIFLNQGLDETGSWLGLAPLLPTNAVGLEPSGIAVGLLDADAHRDLAVANAGDDTVTILLGQGDGTFLLDQSIAVGDEPRAVALASFAGGPRDDLAVAESGNDQVAILENTSSAPGSTSFAPLEILMTSAQPVAIEPENVDDDKDKDCVVVNQIAGTIQAFLLGGDDPFAVEIPVGAQPVAAATGDLDDNGFADIVVANSGESSIAVILNDGGSLQPPSFEQVGATPISVDLGDLDGDGDLDVLAVASHPVLGAVVQILQNRFDVGLDLGFAASFPVENDPDLAAEPVFVASADMDLDGLSDIVTSNIDDGATGGSVTVFLTAVRCGGDVGGDGVIGFEDLTMIILAWGPCPEAPTPCPEDLDVNGQVGMNDLLSLLRFWGLCAAPGP